MGCRRQHYFPEPAGLVARDFDLTAEVAVAVDSKYTLMTWRTLHHRGTQNSPSGRHCLRVSWPLARRAVCFWRCVSVWHMDCGQLSTWSRWHLHIWPDNYDRITNDRSHDTEQGSLVSHRGLGVRRTIGCPRTWSGRCTFYIGPDTDYWIMHSEDPCPYHCLDACPHERRSRTKLDT
eukprot:COSAG01_NODE_14172_length_1487_cov_2.723343_1_plen_176_part_10